ncbi:ATP-grasp domain-containing protein [Nesterenkonia muleiensis]|uniref:ATP-grasp domain-containing protein n=1 Tax=Nesterenkonia muleiensis TaxID=2282648 RepID=UPI000E71C3EA|nr:ATP-grasp domain-containing protein [Nesterenkonia muleiensis]
MMKGVVVELSDTYEYLIKHDIKGGLTSTLIANRAMVKGIRVTPDSKRRLSMQVGKSRIWFDGARSNLNNLLARRCTRYKDVTSRLLQNHGVKTPDNAAFFSDQIHEAWAWASYQLPVVVKPPNEGMGSSVHVGLSEFAEFERAFTAVASLSERVLVERFVPGVEHRVLLIYGQVAAAARRVPANVIGDGTSTIADLVEQKNQLRTESQNPVHYHIPIDEVVVQELKKRRLTLESVPGHGQQVWLRPNSNVHSGGDGVDATDELSPEEIAMAQKVATAIPGLRLAGVDMLLPRDGHGVEPYVLEVNSSPMITGHHYPWVGQSRDAAGMLVDAMFPKSSASKIEVPQSPPAEAATTAFRRRMRYFRRRWRWFRSGELK